MDILSRGVSAKRGHAQSPREDTILCVPPQNATEPAGLGYSLACRALLSFRQIRVVPPDRFDAQGRCPGRERRDGVLFRTPVEERPRPTALGNPGRTSPSASDLDRSDSPPQASPTIPRQTHLDRVWDTRNGNSCRLRTPHSPRQPNSGQSRGSFDVAKVASKIEVLVTQRLKPANDMKGQSR